MARAKQGYDAVVAAPFGRVGIRVRAGALAAIDFVSARTRLVEPKGAVAARVCAALTAYWRDPRAALRLAWTQQGTVFQRRVWRALQAIPPGEVQSYGALACKLRSSARAVGGACRANPVPMVVPCHRVVGRAGLGGFMGATRGPALRIKRWLLAHEHAR